MNIQPKTITQTNTVVSSFKIDKLNDLHATADDPMRGILRIQLSEAVPPQIIMVTGSDYSGLGQWTDESLAQYLITRFSLNTGVLV